MTATIGQPPTLARKDGGQIYLFGNPGIPYPKISSFVRLETRTFLNHEELQLPEWGKVATSMNFDVVPHAVPIP